MFLVPLVVFLGVKFGFWKSCLCKRNDKYEVCLTTLHTSITSFPRFPIGKGIAGHVAETGETLNVADVYMDERFNPGIDEQTGYSRNVAMMEKTTMVQKWEYPESCWRSQLWSFQSCKKYDGDQNSPEKLRIPSICPQSRPGQVHHQVDPVYAYLHQRHRDWGGAGLIVYICKDFWTNLI